MSQFANQLVNILYLIEFIKMTSYIEYKAYVLIHSGINMRILTSKLSYLLYQEVKIIRKFSILGTFNFRDWKSHILTRINE